MVALSLEEHSPLGITAANFHKAMERGDLRVEHTERQEAYQ